jgi:hypothetical protein
MGKPENLESLKARIEDDVRALVQRQAFLNPADFVRNALGPIRIDNLTDPFEAELYSVLERGGIELVRFIARGVAQQELDETLRPAQQLAIVQEVYPFLKSLWLNTGFPNITTSLGANHGMDPSTSRLREALCKAAQSFGFDTNPDVLLLSGPDLTAIGSSVAIVTQVEVARVPMQDGEAALEETRHERRLELQPTERNKLPDAGLPDKGNLNILLDTEGKLKRAVTLDVARRFGGVSRRAIDAAVKKGSLKTEGNRQQRRVLVESLLEYFPQEK